MFYKKRFTVRRKLKNSKEKFTAAVNQFKVRSNTLNNSKLQNEIIETELRI